jgi:trehalose 6-phosphate synthase
VNPFDVHATADALASALAMDQSEREARAEGLRAAATARSPRQWLDDQLTAADAAS